MTCGRTIRSNVVRRAWKRLFLKGAAFSDRQNQLDTLYLIRDPWGMESEREKFRFRETSRLIEANFGRIGRLLEVGCGEGHQSRDLLRICDQLVGIDVSARAVRRARESCPEGTFAVGNIFNDELLTKGERFDLVVACEVLYYMKDVSSALERLSVLGAACLVTYFDHPADRLDPLVLSNPGVESESIQYGDVSWRVAWWRNTVVGATG